MAKPCFTPGPEHSVRSNLPKGMHMGSEFAKAFVAIFGDEIKAHFEAAQPTNRNRGPDHAKKQPKQL